MKIEAYFDESGIHKQAPVCVVAGFYGTGIAWRKFEKRWNTILLDHGLLETGFHSKEFFGRKDKKRIGQYEGWSDQKARNLLERLVQIILSSRVFPIGYASIVADFNALPLVSRQWLTGAKFRKTNGEYISGGCPSKCYYLPFQFAALKSATLSNANATDKIDFFVGLDRTFHEYASELYQFLLADGRLPEPLRSLLGEISYPLSRDTPGVQAADLLAYRIYRGAKEKLAEPNSEPSPLMMRLLKNWKGKRTLPLMNTEIFVGMEKEGQAAYERMIKGK